MQAKETRPDWTTAQGSRSIQIYRAPQDVLEQHTRRRRGLSLIGDVLPAVLARLNIRATQANKNRDRS